ncbi:MAG: pyridoxal phosphate-dependent aminotransferase family protein [Schleiferiaceae bacterium]|jgi:glycine C-acetyltransferase|nr:pyridoxal phosphate-dependent aminotransferase family protein [Schleiferiaceae bacterium]MDR9441247.1 pyridoxal phosphate-dependent aminotransferase family protein [Schleiferiaceae bacterium]
MDLFKKIEKNFGPLGHYQQAAEGYYMFPKLEGPISNRMMFKGDEHIVWSINNYLGLANHPEVRKADAEAAQEWGLAYPMGSRMMSGNSERHEELERRLADFEGKEAAVLLNYGYQGIMSAIDALVGRHDVLVYDAECHACIMDAIRMHLGKSFAYRHNDMQSLETQLQRAHKHMEGNPQASLLVISEGVFGMKGDQGNLRDIVGLKEKYPFRLLVDDAHGFGTLGETGAGAGEEQGVMEDIDVYFATFAKSMASIGAFLAGDKMVMDFLRYNLRSQIFAKSLPMPLVEGNLLRLKMLQEKSELRENLWRVVRALQGGLTSAGFNIGVTNSCVTPVFLKGSVEEAMALVYDLRTNYRIFCSIVIYPVIPKGEIILRLIPTAVHSLDDVNRSIEAFTAIQGRLQDGTYRKMAESYQSS